MLPISLSEILLAVLLTIRFKSFNGKFKSMAANDKKFTKRMQSTAKYFKKLDHELAKDEFPIDTNRLEDAVYAASVIQKIGSENIIRFLDRNQINRNWYGNLNGAIDSVLAFAKEYTMGKMTLHRSKVMEFYAVCRTLVVYAEAQEKIGSIDTPLKPVLAKTQT